MFVNKGGGDLAGGSRSEIVPSAKSGRSFDAVSGFLYGSVIMFF